MQPVYDQTVLPLLDAFDLTPLFSALIDFLDSLDDELGSGLDDVNTAYQSLIALRPGGTSASIGRDSMTVASVLQPQRFGVSAPTRTCT